MIHCLSRVSVPFVVLLALGGCKSQGEQGQILIGHIASFTGPEKRIGEHARQAIELAVARTNKQENGIAGRQVAVLHVDCRGDLDALQPEVVRLIKINGVVAVLGGTSAAEVERLGHATAAYAVALVTPAAVPQDLLADNVFSVNASPSFRGQVLARFASRELKAARAVVLLDGRRISAIALAEAFNKEFSRLSGHVPPQHVYRNAVELARAVEESKNPRWRGGPESRPQPPTTLPAREAPPEAILFAGAAPELAPVRALLRKAALTVPFLFGGTEAHLATLEAATEASDGIYLATPVILEGGGQEIETFAQKYQEQFHEPPDSSALLAYDGIRALVQAMRKQKSIRPRSVCAGLAGFLTEPFESLTGRIVFAQDHSAKRPLFVVRVENGKLREPRRFDPGATE